MFSPKKAKLLQVGEHITLADYPGLRLVAYQQSKTWIYRYKSPLDGRMRQIKVGKWPEVSVGRAVAQWDALRARRDAGEDPAMSVKAQRKKAKTASQTVQYTVARLCDDYWSGHVLPNRNKKGSTEIRRLFDKELGQVGLLLPSAVTRSIAFDLIQSLAERKPVIAGQLRRELGAAWDYAIDSGRIPEETPNWWRNILKGKIRSKGKTIAGVHIGTAKRVLAPEEVGTLIRWFPNLSQMLQDTLSLYLWTCCRGAEIVQAEGRELVEEGSQLWWVIPKTKTKNRWRENATDLRVPLFGRAKQILVRRRERYGDGYLFPGKGKALHVEQKSIQSSLFVYQPYSEVRPEQNRPRLPVTHWAPHDLRRSSRTLLASMGCPNEVGEAILGHIPQGVVGVYNLHAYDKERVEWLGRLSERLEELGRV